MRSKYNNKHWEIINIKKIERYAQPTIDFLFCEVVDWFSKSSYKDLLHKRFDLNLLYG